MLTLIKKNRKLFGLIMLIFTILAFYYTTYGVVSPKSEFYVNDYANVLTNETENYIIKVGKALKEDGLVGEVAPKIQNISMGQDNILDSKEISYWLESLKLQFFKELNDKNSE